MVPAIKKKHELSNIRPPVDGLDSHSIITQIVEGLDFYKQLNSEDQTWLLAETHYVIMAQTQGLSQIELGRRLRAIRERLQWYKGAWTAYVSKLSFSDRSAYRYIKDYEALLKCFPEQTLLAMIRHGFEFNRRATGRTRGNPLGVYKRAYEDLLRGGEKPPTNPASAERYIQKLRLQYERNKLNPRVVADAKKRVERPGSDAVEAFKLTLEHLAPQGFAHLRNSLNKLQGKDRTAYLEQVISPILAEIGVTHLTFHASAAPEEWKKFGRPVQPALELELEASV